MKFAIKPHRVELHYREEDPRCQEAWRWAKVNCGRCDMDWGDWHSNVFPGFNGYNTYVYRFMNPKMAVMFKLMWGGV